MHTSGRSKSDCMRPVGSSSLSIPKCDVLETVILRHSGVRLHSSFGVLLGDRDGAREVTANAFKIESLAVKSVNEKVKVDGGGSVSCL